MSANQVRAMLDEILDRTFGPQGPDNMTIRQARPLMREAMEDAYIAALNEHYSYLRGAANAVPPARDGLFRPVALAPRGGISCSTCGNDSGYGVALHSLEGLATRVLCTACVVGMAHAVGRGNLAEALEMVIVGSPAALSENPLPAEPPQPPENTPAEPPASDLSANDRLPTVACCARCGHSLGLHVLASVYGGSVSSLCFCGCRQDCSLPFFHRDPSGCPIPPAPPGCSCGQTMAITQIEEFALEGGGTAVDFLWECLSCKANTGVRIPGGVRAAASFGRRWLNRSEQFT